MRTSILFVISILALVSLKTTHGAQSSAARLLKDDDLKPVAVLEVKGNKITENVKLFDETELGKQWESKQDLLYKGKVGKWKFIVLRDIATLIFEDVKEQELFKSDPVKLEGTGSPFERARDVEFKGTLQSAAKDGRLYADTANQEHVIFVTVKEVGK